MFDAPIVTKFNFRSLQNKLIEPCWRFFFVSLEAMIKLVDFLKIILFYKMQKSYYSCNIESFKNIHANKYRAILELT